MQAVAERSWPDPDHQARPAAAAMPLLHQSCWLQAHPIHRPGELKPHWRHRAAMNVSCWCQSPITFQLQCLQQRPQLQLRVQRLSATYSTGLTGNDWQHLQQLLPFHTHTP